MKRNASRAAAPGAGACQQTRPQVLVPGPRPTSSSPVLAPGRAGEASKASKWSQPPTSSPDTAGVSVQPSASLLSPSVGLGAGPRGAHCGSPPRTPPSGPTPRVWEFIGDEGTVSHLQSFPDSGSYLLLGSHTFKKASSPGRSNISVYFTSKVSPLTFSCLFPLRLVPRRARGTGPSVFTVSVRVPGCATAVYGTIRSFTRTRNAGCVVVFPNIAGGFFGLCSFPRTICPSLRPSETVLITLSMSGICRFSPGPF